MYLHPLFSTYPGASFGPPPQHPLATQMAGLNGNFNGPHLPHLTNPDGTGGSSMGYWAHVPWEVPQVPMERDPTTGEMRKMWRLPPAIEAAREGRGTGVWGMPVGGRGMRFNYGWPKYGPMPLKPELGGFVGKINPYGRSFPHGFYKTVY